MTPSRRLRPRLRLDRTGHSCRGTRPPRRPRRDARKQLLELAAGTTGSARSRTSPTTTGKAPRLQAAGRRARRGGRCFTGRGRGWTKPAYLHRDARLPRADHARALLSPFDPVVWNRERTRADLRLPLPHRDLHAAAQADLRLLRVADPVGRQIVGRLDLKADRQRGRCWCRALHRTRCAGRSVGRGSCCRVARHGRMAGHSVRSRLCSAATWPPPFAMRSVTTLVVDVRTPVVVAARAPAPMGVESGRHLLARLHPRDRDRGRCGPACRRCSSCCWCRCSCRWRSSPASTGSPPRVAPRTATAVILLGVFVGVPRVRRRDRNPGRHADRRPARRLGELRQRTVDFLNDTSTRTSTPQEVIDSINDPERPVQSSSAASRTTGCDLSVAALGVLLKALSVMLFTFYLVADGPKLRRAICRRCDPTASGGCSSGWDWRSTRPAATCTPGRCSRASRRSSTGSCSRRRHPGTGCAGAVGGPRSASSCRLSARTSPARCRSGARSSTRR